MLTISKNIINQIIAHSQKDFPNEACGYLAGNKKNVTYAYNLTNIDHSHEHFSFDPVEQFKTVKDARSKGLEILANYHSHPFSQARPSIEDVRLAYDPEISYVIISLVEKIPVVKSFRIIDGKVEQEEIRIIE